MTHIAGLERDQLLLLPEAVDDYVGSDNPVRFIDAFVDGLDLTGAGFLRVEAKAMGRPGYAPGDLLKLYIYGYLNRVRSSRRLETECHRNIEVLWLLRTLKPDFKTIADFRRDNRAAFRAVFRQFVLLCRRLDLYGRELLAVDGTRIKAVNNKDRNFTRSSLREFIRRADEWLEDYLKRLDEGDVEDGATGGGARTKNLAEKIAALNEKRGRYQAMLAQLDRTGEDQISLTDPDSRAMPAYGDYQNEIYFMGLSGMKPKLPVNFKLLEQKARAAMPESVLSYVEGGCGDEHTQDVNVTAFEKWGLVPRMMVDCSMRDLSVDLFGLRLPSPLFMAPIGVLGICTQDGHGDLATAKASAITGVPMIASTLSNDPLEAVAREIGGGTGPFQLYTPTDRELAESLVYRAEAAGFKAIVVTLDTSTLGWRPRDLNDANFPQLHGHALANYFSDPRFRALLAKPLEEDRRAAAQHVLRVFGKPLTWADLPWLRSLTRLPLILKGICHPEDARRAIDGGVDGIYCSNHGGRQANGGVAAINMLPAVVAASGETPVLFDSGVRSGTDIVKALALGAKAVGVGRPYAYGLALGGVDGVVHVLRCLLAETDLLMAVDGYPTLVDLTPEALMRV